MNQQNKKVLITGASGLLGSNTARTLYRRGYELRLLVRPGADTRAFSDIPCEIFHGNICSPEEVLEAVKGCGYVVHAASVTAQWGISYREYEQVNITGTKNVTAACLVHKVKKLVYVSTANTIGPGSIDKPASELGAFTLQHLNSGYINSKYVAQQYVLEQVEREKLPAVIVNPTFMIGPYDVKPSSGQIILHGINKRLLFYPPGGKNFVHIQDVCTGIRGALEMGKPGDCYLLAGENLSYREFFSMLSRAEGQNPVMVRIPPFALKSLGMAGSFLGKLTGSTKKLNYASAQLLCLQNYYSGKKSERELQVRYTPVDKAIDSALRWFRENGYC